MGKSFNKFSPRKVTPSSVHDSSPDSDPHPEHDLAGDLPFSPEEANQLLERVRNEEANEAKITSLQQENERLEARLHERSETLSQLIADISFLKRELEEKALEKIVLDLDDIIRDAIRDKVPDLIASRIEEIQKDVSDATFYADPATQEHLGLSLIHPDDQMAPGLIKCVASNGSEFIIEISAS